MDAFNPRALTPAEYQTGTPPFRTELYSGPSSGHLLSHKESIELSKKLGVKMTPELKAPRKRSPSHVFPQSFIKADMLYWISKEPAYGKRAVYLDDANVVADLPGLAELMSWGATVTFYANCTGQ